MSLSQATEHLDNAFTEVDAKINSLTNKIDASFKDGLDGPVEKGPAELMETLVSHTNKIILYSAIIFPIAKLLNYLTFFGSIS